MGEVLLTKHMEKASPKLWQDSVAGDFSSKVTIRVTTTTKDTVTSYLEYQFTDTGLSAYSVNAISNGGLPQESLRLNFATVTWKYYALDAKTRGKPEVVGWDLTQQKKV